MAIMFQERAIDRHFATFICTQTDGECSAIFRLLLSLASAAVGNGNICLNLSDYADQTLSLDGNEIVLPDLDTLHKLLRSKSTIGMPEEHRPLVLDMAGRLYLYRYWRYERDLAVTLLQKASTAAGTFDETILQGSLSRLFPESTGEKSNRQKNAASIALHQQLCVISGGPGTGKTSTVVKIVALLLEHYGVLKHRVAMATPTGKAAARLKASLNAFKPALDCSDEVKLAIPDDVVTIQRLLGTLSASSRFRHSARNPLPYDTVIVDEASMVALPLMIALASALKPTARLILLGDRNQLASVEAGAVLGDICSAGEGSHLSPLNSSMVMLEKNYRFQAGSGIAGISRAVNAGLDGEALALLKSSDQDGVFWQELPPREDLQRVLVKKVIEGYQSYLKAASPSEALERFESFRILSALRDGPYGVSSLNSSVETILARASLIKPESRGYQGRPLLVTVNDYSMRLFNGDTGILFPDIESGGALKAFFSAPDGGIRSIPPERLPIHETAYAMTVHKSQGSEFDRVLMLLPPVDTDILTRELIYTGLTRAKHSVEIWASEGVFCRAVRKKIERRSGLKDALVTPSLISTSPS
ncbi:MAG: exodeoxyribonuclease V subunit alpha [Chlorobiaceae bacterium]|nr:exodeoxyribonuclease V subunit alpha [Chlorobiaceae bacterium]